MIDTKQAIESSINYIKDVYEQLPDLRLEEIELSDKEFWINPYSTLKLFRERSFENYWYDSSLDEND
ncbi:MAG: hypothetical protein LBD03_09640 [Methanobrevibacter sp.]|jgi:hypothetical protein|nr:hypothetical protein [Candidatus Methanovirga procula]